MACQYKFKNGTLCGSNSYNAIYCDGHMIIVLQDELAALQARGAKLATALEEALIQMRKQGNRDNWETITQACADAMNAISNRYGTSVLDDWRGWKG